MRFAIFLRAVNVGGSSVTSVAAIAKKLGLRNIGAAGTFVASDGSATELRKAIEKELPFETEIVVVPASKIKGLVAKQPFARVRGKPYVTLLAKKATPPRALPFTQGSVRYLAIEGPFLLSAILPDAKPGSVPDTEKLFGTRGTSRGWPTIERVAKALEADAE